MKKVIFTLVMMVSSMVAFAQNEVGKISIRPEFGIVSSQLSAKEDTGFGEESLESRFKTGIMGGVEAEYQANEWLGISAGALYTQLGAKGKEGSGIKINYDYIAVPVLANFYPCKGLCLKVGLQPAFNLSAKVNTEGPAKYVFGSDNLRKFDLQVPVGVSYEIRGFVIDARYNVGAVNLFKNGLDASGSKFSLYNGYASLTIGYKFNL